MFIYAPHPGGLCSLRKGLTVVTRVMKSSFYKLNSW